MQIDRVRDLQAQSAEDTTERHKSTRTKYESNLLLQLVPVGPLVAVVPLHRHLYDECSEQDVADDRDWRNGVAYRSKVSFACAESREEHK
jgi:hypothetical protein